MQLERINADGDGTIVYPSGRIAVTVCKSSDGYFHTFVADSDNFQVLAAFDPDGIGSVNCPQGNPWLVTTRDGWMMSNKEGRIQQKGTWPRTAQEPIVCSVTPELTLTFTNRQNLVATFTCADVNRKFQVGEYLRRSEPYTTDMTTIRQRMDTTGSVYTPPGPHRTVAQQPGLGNLKSMIAKMAPDSPIRATISELDSSQNRIAGLITMKQPLYGTSRGESPSSSRPGSSSSVGSLGRSTIGLGPGDSPYGSPQLTPAQQKLAEKLKRAEVTRPQYTFKRHTLPLMTVKQLQKLLDSGAPPDTLIAVCILASWNPVCQKLEHYQLQAAHWQLQQDPVGSNCSTNGTSTGTGNSGSGSSKADVQNSLGPDAKRIKMYKVDGSETRELQQQYGVRTVPFFLMFYQGRLVNASNSVRSKDEFLESALAALAAGRRGEFLPAGYKVSAGYTDSALQSITADMTLL